MGEANVENDGISAHGAAITDTDDFKLFLVTFGNADDGVVDVGTGRSVQSALFDFIAFNGAMDRSVFDLDAHESGNAHA